MLTMTIFKDKYG